MDKLLLFITILSYIFAIASLVRIVATLTISMNPQTEMLIQAAERRGQNPIGNALRPAVIILLVCIGWIITTWL